jgi:hypothetical protein
MLSGDFELVDKDDTKESNMWDVLPDIRLKHTSRVIRRGKSANRQRANTPSPLPTQKEATRSPDPRPLEEINASERPLGLYVFGEDLDAVNKIINNTNSGSAAVNCAAMQGALPSLGFGGSGNSGMGRHHGIEGFREFSNPRGVFTRSKANEDMIKAFMPPYAAVGEPMAAAAYKQAMGSA